MFEVGWTFTEEMNMKIQFLFLVFLFNFLFISNAHARYDYEQCKEYSNKNNKYLPVTHNSYSSTERSFCTPNNNGAILVYEETMDTNQVTMDFSSRTNIVNNWCTDPKLLVLLKQLDIQYNYRSKTGKYLGKINISIDDCRR